MSSSPHWIDITLPFSERLSVWPGDAPVRITQTRDVSVVSELCFSSHAGTHLDAPLHFVPAGATVDQLSFDVLIGPAWVVALGEAPGVTAELLEHAGIPAGVERLLLKTQNSVRVSQYLGDGFRPIPFDESYVALDHSAASWLLAHQVRLIGVDGPSIDAYAAAGFPVHHLLLQAGVVAVENLVLQHVEPGPYRLLCLPLNYQGGEGAPARVVLETIE